MKRTLLDMLGKAGLFVFYVAVLVVAALVLWFGATTAGKLSPYISAVILLVFAAQILLAMLSCHPRMRLVCGSWILSTSVVFGVFLWLRGLLVAYALWGIMAVVIGIFMAGVGVVPVAMLACLFKGEWGIALEFCACIGWLFGSRFFGAYQMRELP